MVIGLFSLFHRVALVASFCFSLYSQDDGMQLDENKNPHVLR